MSVSPERFRANPRPVKQRERDTRKATSKRQPRCAAQQMIENNERGDAEAERERQQACASKCRRGFRGSPAEFASVGYLVLHRRRNQRAYRDE